MLYVMIVACISPFHFHHFQLSPMKSHSSPLSSEPSSNESSGSEYHPSHGKTAIITIPLMSKDVLKRNRGSRIVDLAPPKPSFDKEDALSEELALAALMELQNLPEVVA